ncbi:MAG: type 1 glutamine amidotransferase, partial [Mycolicibacterium sp.]|nr:type 1 glutamine amidotransferase [Mycolicibacterium sp.]
MTDTSTALQGMKFAILATDGVERRELAEPRDAIVDAGGAIELLSLHDGEIEARDHDLEPAGTFRVDRRVEGASADEFDALVIPGGTVNADKLRSDESAVAFVRRFVESGRPVAVICHGPWVLIDAGVVEGRTVTSYPSLRIDLRNAGAKTVDEEVVVDGNLITSRTPDDLPAFCDALLNAVAKAPAPQR